MGGGKTWSKPLRSSIFIVGSAVVVPISSALGLGLGLGLGLDLDLQLDLEIDLIVDGE